MELSSLVKTNLAFGFDSVKEREEGKHRSQSIESGVARVGYLSDSEVNHLQQMFCAIQASRFEM